MQEILKYTPYYIIYVSVILAIFGFYKDYSVIVYISGVLFGLV